MGIEYAHEKFTNAVDALATSASSLQSRLISACLNLTSIEADNDLPDYVREDFEDFWSKVTAMPGREGSVRTTLQQKTDDEAVALANQLVNLNYEITEEFYKQRANPQPNKNLPF